MLMNNGFTPELAARSNATLSRYVLGFAIQLAAGSESHAAQDSTAFRDVDASRFPATLAAADALPIPLGIEFAFGLNLIIKGLNQIH
jgi:TetR/AcrR family transcriptional regulator, tetracycline repressor protein